MNCREFESILADLAADRKMDEPARHSGLVHTETCKRCATALAVERTLLAGLRAAMANTALESAPPSVERELRLAFRRTMASSTAAVNTPPSGIRHRPLWALGAVALIIGALIVSLLPFRHRVSNPEPAQDVQKGSAPTTKLRDSELPASPPSAVVQQYPRGGAEKVFGPVPNRARRLVRHNSKGHESNRQNGKSEIMAGSSEAEITTDFLPLGYAPSSSRLEHGQVVRVKLPRLALISCGLPMNEARAHEPIEAEVVLGEDGTARAIRFVH